ncbi:hypothetical protein GCM10022416_57780 [Actinomadura keratinilytica]|uniref:Uncharacterized protein n=2 Tax=Actinomadura keratinilytica TaxID=547461 RepID=A0ABP7ZFY6_9ACTN
MTGERPCRIPPSEADQQAVLAWIRREFPEVLAWYGRATGSWWAMVRVGARWRLVEAVDPVELRGAILNPAGWPWPRNWVALPETAPGMPGRMSRGISG